MVASSAGNAAAATGFDLRVALSAATLKIAPGGSAPITITWRNAGPAAASGATVTYIPPLRASLVASSLPAGWSMRGRVATRVLGRQPAGSSGSVTLRVTVAKEVPPGALLVGGSATISGTPGKDAKPADNDAVSRVSVIPAAVPSPSRTPTPSKTPSARVSPTASPKPVPRPTPTTVPAPPSPVRTSAAPAGPATVTRPSPRVSTFIATPPDSVTGVIQVVDAPEPPATIALAPLAGAATCFTAAGFGIAVLRRRRLTAEDADLRNRA